MKFALILSILLVCGLVFADTTDIIPPTPVNVREKPKVMLPESLFTVPSLREVREKIKVIPPESLLTSPALQKIEGRKKITPEEFSPIVPTPPSVQEKPKVVLPESGLSVQPLSPVQERRKNITEWEVLGVPGFQPVQSLEPTAPPFEPLQAPSLSDVSMPEIAELNSFEGGLNLVSFPTHVAKNEAIELINALWNPQGEMYKRPGYSVHSTPPEVLNFLYRYYQQDGDKWTMGGSDTALYFWHEDSSGDGWTYLIGTEGASGRWDGTTFEDWFVGTHEGIRPVKFDGSSISYLGEASYLYDSTWADNCTLWVHVEDVAWEDNELVAMYAVQDSPAYQDGGRCFGKIIDNTIDAFAIDYNAQSGSNLWTPDAEVTLISALSDSIWVGGVIDTFYSEAFEGEILTPSVDTIASQWSTKPDTLTNHWQAILSPSFYSYIYSSDSTQKEMIGFSDHTSSLTSVEKIKVTFWAIANDQCCANLDLRVCIGDTTVSKGGIFFIEGYGTEPPYPDYFEYYFEMNRDPRGNVWTTDVLDSLVMYFRVYNKSAGATGEILVFWMQIEVTYDEFELNCAVAIFDSSLFDTLLTSPIDIPTYFEWIPQDLDTGTAGRERREILTTGQGIIGTHYYLLISLPEIPDLAVGDSFNLRRIYFTTAKYVEVFGDRVWLGQTGSGADLLKNNIIYSNLNSLSNFPPENHILIEAGVGDEITGMKTFPTEFMDVPQYELNVFQNNAFYKILPDFTAGDYAPELYLIADGIGCVSNSAISPAEGLLLFPDQHGVWAYDKREPIPISKLIKPIFETWNLEYLENVSARYNPQDRHYYLSYPGNEGIYQGQFIVSYDVDTSGCNPCGIYTNIVDTDGSKLGGHNDIVGASDYNDIAVRNNGDYVIVWDSPPGGSVCNVWLQKFNALGEVVGDSIQLNDVDDSCSLYWPSADMNKDGDIVVCWEDFRDGRVDDEQDIYCQCLTWDGGLSGSNFPVNATYAVNELDAHYPDVAINDNGFFVVTWTDSLNHIYAQKYDSCGSASGSNFSVKFDDQNQYSSVAVGEDNQFVVVWRSTDGASAKDIWMRFYDSDGTAGDSTLVNTADAGRNHDQVDVAMNSNGKFVIVWQKDSTDAGERNIYARKYNADGTASGTQFLVNDPDAEVDVDLYAAVAINDNDDFLIVWEEDKNADRDIYGRLYTWSAAIDTAFPINDDISVETAKYPKIAVVSGRIGAATHAFAWSFDFHGWSRETFVASAYAYQHSLSDTVKIIFADTDRPKVYNYGTQSDDVNDAVILTYQSPFFRFSPYPWQRALISYATIESYSDTGEVILSWYSDYGTLIVEDTLTISGYDLQTIDQNGVIEGENISLKITASADNFKLAGYYLEYLIDKSRR